MKYALQLVPLNWDNGANSFCTSLFIADHCGQSVLNDNNTHTNSIMNLGK